MKNALHLVGIVVIAIALIMLLSPTSTAADASATGGAMAVAPAAMPAGGLGAHAASATPSAHVLTGAAATQARVLSAIKAGSVPARDLFLPNFEAQVAAQKDLVSPTYNVSPAPMGIGDIGVQDIGGHNVATVTETSSVTASVTLNSVDPVFVTSSAPDIFTMQLNTVGVNVDLFGNTSYQFWLQNVPEYYAGSQTLGFEDNIWNFSSPAFYFTANSIYSHGPYGFVDGNLAYLSGGPSFHVPTPFTVTTYNNLSVQNGRSSIYFNYTVLPPGGPAFSGSYDHVEFNSTPNVYGPAPAPSNEINGNSVDKTGYLLNDAEIMIGGPGGGSTTTMLGINGQMSLRYLPNGSSTYQDVPAAMDLGVDTGETSEGIAEWSTAGANPVAMLGDGPSLLYPLWGIVGAHRGEMKVTINLTPSNAFVFATIGKKFSESFGEWAPTPATGPATYVLPPGDYTFRFLLSDHDPQTITYAHATVTSVTLTYDPSWGDYTPLWAQGNDQLAAISAPGGAGTIHNPYVLDNGAANIDPLFGEVNDFDFAVFPGIQLIDTTAYVTITQMPAFDVSYLPIWDYAGRLTLNGLPLNDQLGMVLYYTSHVSIVSNPTITGWFYTDTSFGEPASVYLWGATDTLIAGNTFDVESNGITASLGSHNLIWGNVFVPTPPAAANPGAILNYGAFPAIWEFEPTDLIFNNAFLTPITAINEPVNFYTGGFEINLDRWSVPVQPSSDVTMKNGWDLSGSILGLSWEGGNYWANYGASSNPYGVLPYKDGGAIYSGGDYHPLITVTLYAITFTETGVPAGHKWSVDLNGYTQTSRSGQTSMTFWEPNGLYAWVANPSHLKLPTPASGAAIVNGAAVSVSITYS
jgi:thermopsin